MFEQGFANSPKNADAYASRGIAGFAMGNLDAAIGDWLKPFDSIQTAPQHIVIEEVHIREREAWRKR